MISLAIFCEDDGHHLFLEPFIGRVASNEGASVRVVVRHATGGAGAALASLKRYIVDLERARAEFIQILVVAVDANSVGVQARTQQIQAIVKNFAGHVVLAIPDPHIEAWLLADPKALPTALGVSKGLPAMPHSTDYKKMLADACKELGTETAAGGIEYAKDVALALRVPTAGRAHPAFKRFAADLQAAIRQADN